MDNIVERLLDSAGELFPGSFISFDGPLLVEAAEEIKRLRAEVNAVKNMHHRFHNGDADNGATICYGCGKRWPCPTITAIEEARRD